MPSNFLAPDGTTVIGLSHGYDGALDESDVPAWQMYLGAAGTVRDAADWAVTAVSSQSVPTVQVAAGQGGQDGIMDNTTAVARLTVPVPATTGEIRSYFVVVARSWAGSGGRSQFTLRAAGVGATVPADADTVNKIPGDLSDQILALVQVRGGSTAVINLIDRRVTGAKVYQALGAQPPVATLPLGARLRLLSGDDLTVTRDSGGNKVYARRPAVGVLDVGVSTEIYPGLPDSTRRPGGNVKAWGDTRRNIAQVTLNADVPYRVSGVASGVFGADDNPASDVTRWDWHVRAGTDGPSVGVLGVLGFGLTREEHYARYREVQVPLSSEVFLGSTQFVLQGIRQTGNGLGVALTGSFRFRLAIHPAL